MHVKFYRCFDRLLGSWIINQFLNYYIKHVADENTGNHQPGGIELMYQQFLRTKNEKNA